MPIDLEKERQRLTILYADMPSEQLEQIASESSDLTEIAKTVLTAEISRRGLVSANPGTTKLSREQTGLESIDVEEAPQAIEPHGSDKNLVTIRRFRGLFEAHLAKASLDSAGIECFLADENMVRMDWFYSDAVGGVKLLVNEADASEAAAVLDQPIPESFDVEGVGEYQQPHCPHCGSLDISLGAQPSVYGSLFDDKPVPVPVQGWYCHKCSHTWEDTGEESASAN